MYVRTYIRTSSVGACMHMLHVRSEDKPVKVDSLLLPHGICGLSLVANAFLCCAILVLLALEESFAKPI